MVETVMNEVKKLQFHDASMLPEVYSSVNQPIGQLQPDQAFADEEELNRLGMDVLHCYDQQFMRLCLSSGEVLYCDKHSDEESKRKFMEMFEETLKRKHLVCFSI